MTLRHYMDHNATAPIRPEVVEAVTAAFGTTGNPSSVHGFGRAARAVLEEARRSVAALVGARSQDVVFTAGGTEANNLALRGGRRRVLASAGEHDSVLRAVPDAERVALNADGTVDLETLERMLSTDDRPALLSIMLANNETGVIQPVPEAVKIARRHGVMVHCDAVQAAGRIAVDLPALDVDLLTLSAHKIGGPQGVGALILGAGIEVTPLMRGGGQERRRRAGTENVAGCAGFGVAAKLAADELNATGALSEWRDEIERRISALAPGCRIFGHETARLSNTLCITMPGVPAETQVMALDLAGVAVSSGSACSSGKVQPSHVLRAMGASDGEAASAIRVSLGWSSRAEDAEAFVAAWAALYRRHEKTAPAMPIHAGSPAEA